MYKIEYHLDNLLGVINSSKNEFYPADPTNTDYQRFKTEVNADEAQLKDADGNLMTAEKAKQFVATLP